MTKPKGQGKRLCGAKTKAGGKCQRAPMLNGRCYRHGGATPRGMASANFVHGFRVRHLPPDLAQLTQDAKTDPELMQLRVDLATVEALLNTTTARLKDGRAVPLKTEKRILELIESRRRLVETEAKRQRDLNLMVPGERFTAAMNAAANAIAQVLQALCVTGVEPGADPAPFQDQVRRKFQQLRLPVTTVIEGEKVDG